MAEGSTEGYTDKLAGALRATVAWFDRASPRDFEDVATSRTRRLLGTMLVFLPTLLSTLYYGLLCTDRYVSEARFVVRAASKPSLGLGGLSSLLQFVGISSAQDDTYAVGDFLTSRDALRELGAQVDLRHLFGNPGADFLSRYPSILYGRTDEDFYRYFQRWLTVRVNNTSEIATLRVEAFSAADAQKIAGILLAQGEALVNRLNDRMQNDAVKVAAAEVSRAETRRVDAQIALTDFRNREFMLDPANSAVVLNELIGRLTRELAATRAELEELHATAPDSENVRTLNIRAAALQHQIEAERARVANGSGDLAGKIEAYEKLKLEDQFATRVLTQAVTALEAAKVEARRQQIFLERIVEPGLPDKAMEPRRLRIILTVLGFNLIGAGVFWLFAAGFREHAAHRGH